MLNPFFIKWPFLFKLRVFLGLILVVLVFILLYFKIVPFGAITYSRSWPVSCQSGQGFIGDFKSSTQIGSNIPQSSKMVLDQIYFLLFTPRRFNQATVTIQYLDELSSNTPIIELGVLKNKLLGTYDYQAILNNTSDNSNSYKKYLKNGDPQQTLLNATDLILPVESNNYKTASATFDLSNADRSSGNYTFTILIPGLNNQADIKNYLEIKKITINLNGTTLWQKIWK